jgi:hypothetical protein
MTTEIIALLANLALALSFVVGLVFGIVQVRTAARDRKERFTLETLRNFQTHEFAELILTWNLCGLFTGHKVFGIRLKTKL